MLFYNQDPAQLTLGLDLDNDGRIDQRSVGPLGVDLDNDGKVDIVITPEQLRAMVLERGGVLPQPSAPRSSLLQRPPSVGPLEPAPSPPRPAPRDVSRLASAPVFPHAGLSSGPSLPAAPTGPFAPGSQSRVVGQLASDRVMAVPTMYQTSVNYAQPVVAPSSPVLRASRSTANLPPQEPMASQVLRGSRSTASLVPQEPVSSTVGFVPSRLLSPPPSPQLVSITSVPRAAPRPTPPLPARAPEVRQQIVERPVYIDRIIEKPVYIEVDRPSKVSVKKIYIDPTEMKEETEFPYHHPLPDTGCGFISRLLPATSDPAAGYFW